MKSPKQGSDTLVHAALSPELKGKGGTYLENSKIAPAARFTDCGDAQKKLWTQSLAMIGIPKKRGV